MKTPDGMADELNLLTNSKSNTKTAVVTGATGGLGSCFARKLAQRDFNLLLVDRDGQPLESLCDEISSQHSVSAKPYFADLSDYDQVTELGNHLGQIPDMELLVNNAGFGHNRYFVDVDVESHLDMIRVHMLAPVQLSRAVLPGMMERDCGAIINVSSLCAWAPAASVVQYAATKAYLISVSRGIQDELRGTNVRIQALCPGFVQTDFFYTDRMRAFDPKRIPGVLWVTQDAAVECSLKSLRKKRVVVIPGFLCRIIGQLMQMPVARPFVQAIVREKRFPDRLSNDK